MRGYWSSRPPPTGWRAGILLALFLFIVIGLLSATIWAGHSVLREYGLW